MGDFRHVALALWDGMAYLKQSLKTGQPLSRMDTGGELQVWEKLVIGIIPIAEPVAKALCDVLRIGVTRKGLRVLDVAGSSSIFGMTILGRDPSAQITQLDWPNVNAVEKNWCLRTNFLQFFAARLPTSQRNSGKVNLLFPSRCAPSLPITTVSPQRIESGASAGMAPGLRTKTLPSTRGKLRCIR
jgi:hypothetical protein